MHYYVNGNRTGYGSCHLDYGDARDELLRLILKKTDQCDSYQLRAVARGMGKVAEWIGTHENEEVIVGSDTWCIMECDAYDCSDTNGNSDW
jgi:hypothetical protein